MLAILAARPLVAKSVIVGAASTIVIALVRVAAAGDDAGIHRFYSAQGGNAASLAEAASQPSSAPASITRIRPLTVHAARRTLAHARPNPKAPVVAQRPSVPPVVSIYEDRTLRRGDAVMTVNGIRIFAGSKSWPYRAKDFLALGQAPHLSSQLRNVLVELDKAPLYQGPREIWQRAPANVQARSTGQI